ncbi:MAG: electron transfer flavoprotein subunit alpha/FixB family protein [Bradymonadales bacterium]|nr:electron transfer flavoprotein subunit alpha/FixB family protein [Bradymonadales bacterium]
MGNVLVVAEHSDQKLRKVSLPAVTFAKQAADLLGGQVIGLVVGSQVKAVAQQFAVSGVDRVICLDDPSFVGYLAESVAPAVAEVAKEVQAQLVCCPASVQGKDYLPRVAAILDAGMVSEAVAVWKEGDHLRFKRPLFAGNILAKVAVDGPVAVATVRTTEFEPLPPGAAAPIEERTSAHPTSLVTFKSFVPVVSERPDLNDATVVVAGGRGLKSKEGFALAEQLADTLTAAIGASRAAVDAGWVPNDWQVGQTGKIVAPSLYIAIGISGAIQHVAGMRGSKTIVAINKDEEAPIFQVADYGLVADAAKAVPELIEQIRSLKG